MAENTIIVDIEDDRPIAERRKRRSSSSASINTRHTRSNSTSNSSINPPPPGLRNGMNTPPATPQRTKKRVRFSEPGPSVSSPRSSPSTGLTPFIRRASLTSSPSRRQSTPSSSSRWNLAVDDTPISGTLQFAPLRQVLEGRVKRRIRRNRLSEEYCLIESERVIERKEKQNETSRLREELRLKDLEIQHLRDEQDIHCQIEEESGVPMEDVARGHNARRVKQLEQQITLLKAELHRSQEEEADANEHDWISAGGDAYTPIEDDDAFMQNFSEEFSFENGAHDSNILLSTPSRRHSRHSGSFPSPPSTTPNTPSKVHSGIDAMTQAEDGEKKMMQTQLVRLKEEISNIRHRLSAKLAPFAHVSSSSDLLTSGFEISDLTTLDSALDAVITELAVAQSSALDNSTRFEALSEELAGLSSDPSNPPSPDETLCFLKEEFRKARLELERLQPGETEPGFCPPTAIFGALLHRLSFLVSKVQRQEDDIDAYHEQEFSLRQQLGSRIDVNTALESSLNNTLGRVAELEAELEERDMSIAKLTRALETYRKEVQSLEKLVTQLEASHSETLKSQEIKHNNALEALAQGHKSALLTVALEKDTILAGKEVSETLLAEFEKRLIAATSSSSQLEEQLASLTKGRDTAAAKVKKLNTTHGVALALRDARVTELRSEVDRVNTALRDAHAQILTLRNQKQRMSHEMEGLEQQNAVLQGEKSGLEESKSALLAQVDAERHRGKIVIDSMQAQLARALETGTGYLNGELSTRSGLTPRKAPVHSSIAAASGSGDGDVQDRADLDGGEDQGAVVVVQAPTGRLFESSLARRGPGKGKKRRRYDSGLGFLEEGGDEVDITQ